MSDLKKRKIAVATNAELMNERNYELLWRVVVGLNISSRSWADEISKLYLQKVEFIYPWGEKFDFDVEREFPPNSYRWILFYKEADKSGRRPRRTSHLYRRLRLLDLYVKVHHSEKARAIFNCV